MASPTRWAWVWVNSGSWWWTGRPGMLWFKESQGVGQGWVTKLNWLNWKRQKASLMRPGFDPWVGKSPWKRAWQPTSVFLPGEPARTVKPGGLQSMGLQRVGHSWVTKHTQSTNRQKIYMQKTMTLVKKIKDDTNKWRDIPCSWIEELILWKWLYYPKQSTDSMQSLSNDQWYVSQN